MEQNKGKGSNDSAEGDLGSFDSENDSQSVTVSFSMI